MAATGSRLFGNQMVESTVEHIRGGSTQAFPYASAGSGTVTAVVLYVDRSNRAARIAVALYSSSGCRPGRLITGGRLSHPARGTWDAVAIRKAPVKAGRTYWLAVAAPANLAVRARPSTSCHGMTSVQASGSSVSRSWRGATPGGICALSAFARGTAAGKTAVVASTPGATAVGGSSGGGGAAPTSTTGGAGAQPVNTTGVTAGGTQATPPAAPVNTSPPVISGSPVVGQSLSTSTGTWSGITPWVYAYQWQDCDVSGGNCADIVGATSSAYTVTNSDLGHTIRSVVSVDTTSATSNPTTVVTNGTPPAPQSTSRPTITGTPAVGSQLGASTGQWTNNPTSFAYQWLHCSSGSCSAIPGATQSNYAVASGDAGQTIEVVVTASNAGGSNSATSSPTAQVPTPPSGAPAPAGNPRLSGTAQQGQSLSATAGAWSNSPSSYSYQWYDCDAVGNNCAAIPNATSSSYSPAATDVGYTEKVAVTAANASGSSTSYSELSPAVAWSPVTASAANIWVSPTAGSCSRSASAVAFNPATACGSLGAAYAVARCGDTILIESGDYSGTAQEIARNADDDSCASYIVMEPGPGQTPVFGQILDGNLNVGASGQAGGSWLVLANLSMTGMRDPNASDKISIEDAHNVVLEGIHGGAIYLNDPQHLLVENSSFGPCATGTVSSANCHNNDMIDSDGFPGLGNATKDVTIRSDTFHDFSCNTSGCHFECIFVSGGTDIMIDSDTFERCQLQTIFIQPAQSTSNYVDDLTIQNNWIMQNGNSTGGARPYAVDVGANNGPPENLVVRYNSFDSNDGPTNSSGSVGNEQIVANVIAPQSAIGCISGATYGYNIWDSGGCAASDGHANPLPYVNQTAGSQDFHLVCNSVAKNFVPGGTGVYALAYDHDGNWRSQSGSEDAGAEGETSCGT